MSFWSRVRDVLNEDLFGYFNSLGKTNMNKDLQNLPVNNLRVTIKSKDKNNINTEQKPNFKGKKTAKTILSGGSELPDFLKDAMDMNSSEEVRSLIKQTSFRLKERAELISELKRLRANDIVETILDVMVDDGLLSSSNNKIFNIVYTGEAKKDEIQTEIDMFVRKHKPDRLVLEFIDEALLLGEYFLPLEIEEGQGITKILDNADVDKMVCVYEGQKKKYFIKKVNDRIECLEPESHIHFVMNHKKLRVEVKDFESEYISSKHIKVGRSVIFPVINKLKQLQVLEMANLASDLREILRPTIIQVSLPHNTLPENVGDIMERYENMFRNLFSALKDTDNLSFGDLLSIITEVKALPSFGDSKGNLTSPDVIPKVDNKEKEEAIRKSIALTVGVPFYYLSLSGENPVARLEAMKLFSRYSRKLNGMQSCIIEGLKELTFIHLKARGYLVNTDDIKIEMREIVNVELLDNMEYLVALVTAIESLMGVLTSISDNKSIDIEIDSKALLVFLNNFFKEFPGAEQLLVRPDKNNSDSNNNNDTQKKTIKVSNGFRVKDFNNNLEDLHDKIIRKSTV